LKRKRKLRRKRATSRLFFLGLIVVLLGILYMNDSSPSRNSDEAKPAPLPTGLHPTVKEQTKQLIQQSAKKGIVVVITDGFRSPEDQDRLYEQGRTIEGDVVTNAKGGESYHNYGLAIDFALKTPSGDIIWDRQYDGNKNRVADWSEVVKIAKNLGFEWGGDWAQFKDYPHLQMDFGLTIADLQNGERPPDNSSLIVDSKQGE
jgi:peptidoglycan L-alanyl-D-glutamate endopeptidase CwlK